MWNAIEYDKRYLNEMLKMTVEQYGAENDIECGQCASWWETTKLSVRIH